jgi:hypothetical protein
MPAFALLLLLLLTGCGKYDPELAARGQAIAEVMRDKNPATINSTTATCTSEPMGNGRVITRCQ